MKSRKGIFKAALMPCILPGERSHMAYDICKSVPQWRLKSGGQGDGQADTTRVFHF